jgi:hypothetical protein
VIVLSGDLRRHTYRRLRRGNSIPAILMDFADPLPPFVIWTLSVPDPDGRPSSDDPIPHKLYRTRSGDLPAALTEDMEGERITVRARVTPWSNGIGGWLSHVKHDETRTTEGDDDGC